MSDSESSFRTAKYGFGFKDGKLYHFIVDRVVVLKLWPEPCCWVKTAEKPWHASRAMAALTLSRVESIVRNCPQPEKSPWLDLSHVKSTLDDLAAAENVQEDDQSEMLCLGQSYFARRLARWRWRHETAAAKHQAAVEAAQYYHAMLKNHLDAIPREVQSELWRYPDRHWHLLSLFARCPGALDLSRSNPALCYMLASNWVFHDPAVTRPMRAARSLVRKKQRRILDWLGFPATESTRHFLQKINPKDVSIPRLLNLRRVMLEKPEIFQWLTHARSLNRNVLDAATNSFFEPYLTSRLFNEFVERSASRRRRTDEYRLLRDTAALQRRLPDSPTRGHFSSLRQLRAYHDELTLLDQQRWANEEREADAFPPPPFPGTEAIRPLTDSAALYREGIEMQHCVGSYAYRVMAGYCYIYQVLAPIRATLEIEQGAQLNWVPGSLFQKRNEAVSDELRRKIFKALFASEGSNSDTGDDRQMLLPLMDV